MAGIKVYSSREKLPSVGASVTVNPAAFSQYGRATARVFEQAANDLGQFAAKQNEARNIATYLQANADATTELTAVEDDILHDPAGTALQAEDPDYQPDPAKAVERFTETAKSIRDRLADRFTDPTSKLRFTTSFDRLAAAKASNVRGVAWKAEVDDKIAGLDNSLDGYAHAAARAGNDVERGQIVEQATGAIREMAAGNFITETDAGKRTRAFAAKLDEADARQLITRNPGAAAKALAGSEAYPNIDETKRALLTDLAERRQEAMLRESDRLAEKAQRERDKAEEQRRQAALSVLDIQVHRGEAGYGEIEQAYADGRLEPRERTRLTLKVDELRKDEIKSGARVARVSAALAGVGVLDPRDSEDKKSVDAYFTSVVAPTLADAPAPVAFQAIADFAGRAGIIPDEARGMIRGGLRAGDDDHAFAAADLLDRLEARNPQLLNDFAAEDIALGKTIASDVKSGAEPKDAIARARAALALPAAEKKLLAERYKADKQPAANTAWLKSEATGGWFSALPGAVPAALAAEFEDKVGAAYERMSGGNIDAARAIALGELKRVWAPSVLGGKPGSTVWMKYAPEAVYGNGGDTGWIAEQLKSEVAAREAPIEAPVFLQADAQTAREQAPTYQVWQQLKSGELAPVLGADGRPARWRPDFAKSPAGQRARDAAARDIERLRGERATTIDLQRAGDAFRRGSISAIDEAARRANEASDRPGGGGLVVR